MMTMILIWMTESGLCLQFGRRPLFNAKNAALMENSSESAAFHFSVLDCLAVLAGYPANLTIHYDGVPAVLRGGDPFERSTVRNRSNALILRAVAHSDIH